MTTPSNAIERELALLAALHMQATNARTLCWAGLKADAPNYDAARSFRLFANPGELSSWIEQSPPWAQACAAELWVWKETSAHERAWIQALDAPLTNAPAEASAARAVLLASGERSSTRRRAWLAAIAGSGVTDVSRRWTEATLEAACALGDGVPPTWRFGPSELHNIDTSDLVRACAPGVKELLHMAAQLWLPSDAPPTDIDRSLASLWLGLPARLSAAAIRTRLPGLFGQGWLSTWPQAETRVGGPNGIPWTLACRSGNGTAWVLHPRHGLSGAFGLAQAASAWAQLAVDERLSAAELDIAALEQRRATAQTRSRALCRWVATQPATICYASGGRISADERRMLAGGALAELALALGRLNLRRGLWAAGPGEAAETFVRDWLWAHGLNPAFGWWLWSHPDITGRDALCLAAFVELDEFAARLRDGFDEEWWRMPQATEAVWEWVLSDPNQVSPNQLAHSLEQRITQAIG